MSDKTAPLSMVEAMQQRKYLALQLLPLDITVGTLWWVQEAFWKKSYPEIYDQQSTRDAHPGLSIQQRFPATPFEMIPMLHGTSGSQGPLRATGISDDSDHVTSFGSMRPAMAGLNIFYSLIKPNKYKPRLDHKEHAALLNWMKQKDLTDE